MRSTIDSWFLVVGYWSHPSSRSKEVIDYQCALVITSVWWWLPPVWWCPLFEYCGNSLVFHQFLQLGFRGVIFRLHHVLIYWKQSGNSNQTDPRPELNLPQNCFSFHVKSKVNRIFAARRATRALLRGGLNPRIISFAWKMSYKESAEQPAGATQACRSKRWEIFVIFQKKEPF